LLRDAQFLRIIKQHPWIAHPDNHIEAILDDPELLSALLIYLRACQTTPPRSLLRLLECRGEDLPGFDRRWCQILVQRYLREQAWPLDAESEKHREAMARRLRAAGLLWRRELRLQASAPMRNLLRLTKSKVQACVEIYRLESRLRNEALRQVVLADFIRDDGSDQLGARPIFQALLSQMPEAERCRLALLTGRLAILHEDQVAALRDALGRMVSGFIPDPAAVPVLVPVYVRPRRRR